MPVSSDVFRVSRLLRTLAGLTLLASSVAVSGCDDDNDDFVNPDPLSGVAVFKDDAIVFGGFRTFTMPDTVVHVLAATGTPVSVPRDLDQVLLNEVRANFLARGYTQATLGTRPDFVVLVSATASQKYQAFVTYPWYGYWGFYDWSWYAPGFTTNWGEVYPWQPTVTTVQYDRGTVVVDMIPTLSVNPLAQTVTSAWAGVGTGVMDGSLTADIVIAAVDRMFELSPYLRPVGASAARRTPEMGTKFKRVDDLLNR
jgi:hypothetical protein